MEFACSICNYTSERKAHIISHINKKNKCGDGIPEIVEIPIDISCEQCNKEFATKSNLKRHLKSCKVKNKKNIDIKEDIKEELSTVIIDKIKELETQLKKSIKQSISIVKLENNITPKSKADKNMIRNEARKIYKENFKMKCVHCKHDNEDLIQICHIKPIRDYSVDVSVGEINKLENLIGLCANCHLELDKSKNFKVLRTAIIHSFIVNHLNNIKITTPTS